MLHKINSQRAFTLIEVLVAMAILAVALAAASRAASLSINHQIEIKQRVLADIVAQNRLAEHLANDDWLQGSFSGMVVQGGVQFLWKEEISATPNPAFNKVVITVFNPINSQHQLRRLVGFLVNPSYQYAQ